MNGTAIDEALLEISAALGEAKIGFAVVGGIAVSVRGEVRFTRDVDVAVAVADDGALERLVRGLSAKGFTPGVLVEREKMGRIATVRMRARSGVTVDLIAASSGIEKEIVETGSDVPYGAGTRVPFARAEELLATKVLSMNEQRPQDRIDARALLAANPELDLDRVRALLATIRARGFDRGEDLEAKLAEVLAARTGVSSPP